MAVTVNDVIKLLDKEENKYGGITGKERELNLSINGDFVGTITSAKLDGWGDGLVTNVTLEVRVSSMKYHDEKIRNKIIDEFINRLRDVSFPTHENYSAIWLDSVDEIAEQMKGE